MAWRLVAAVTLLAGSLLFLQMRLLAASPRSPYPPCRPGPAGAPVVRLHVVAASDSPADQGAKARVREAVAPLAARLAASARDSADALGRLGANGEALRRAAAGALAEAGARDGVVVETGWHRFPGGSLAAGCYPSVVVTIGRGRGHNWWCVLYPPMCLPVAAAGKPRDGAAPSAGGSATPTRPAPPRERPAALRWYVGELAARLFSRRVAPVRVARTAPLASASTPPSRAEAELRSAPPARSHMLIR